MSTKEKLESIESFSTSKQSLKETSKSQPDRKVPPTYMTEITDLVYNYDLAIKRYIRENNLGVSTPSSPDALAVFPNDHIEFIEFKSGRVVSDAQVEHNQVNENIHRISKKIEDGILYLQHALQEDNQFFRENANFTLVYNNEKNNLLYIKERTAKRARKKFDPFRLSKKYGDRIHEVNFCSEKSFNSYYRRIARKNDKESSK